MSNKKIFKWLALIGAGGYALSQLKEKRHQGQLDGVYQPPNIPINPEKAIDHIMLHVNGPEALKQFAADKIKEACRNRANLGPNGPLKDVTPKARGKA